MQNAQSHLGRVNVVSDDNQLGQVSRFQDADYTILSKPVLVSCLNVYAVLVKNSSAAAMLPGLGYTFKSGAVGTEVGALSGANAICDGICDPWIPAAGCPIGSTCLLIIKGPTLVKAGAGDIAANALLQTLANGLFTSATPGTNPIGHSGRADEAAASGSFARALFNNPFSAVQC